MLSERPILFQRYPELEDKIQWKQFISTSTPVERMDGLEKFLDYSGLWVKRDDITGTLYGGNKTRKLEFIIGDALARKKKWFLTFGGLGSNHALATAIYSREVGIKTVLALIDQPVTEHVKKQLLRFVHYGAKISYAKNMVGAVMKGLWHLLTKQGVYF
ncbi:MAG: pyridoxal-phosphate dependent enzyme, partial [Candidatus Thorarchaeota archaeon]